MPNNQASAESSHLSGAQFVHDAIFAPQNHHADSADDDDDGGVATLWNAQDIASFQQQATAHNSLLWPFNPPPYIPTAMSQLSQQLAQIQEAQGSDPEVELAGHIGSVHQYSTPPTLPFLSHVSPFSTGFDNGEDEAGWGMHTTMDISFISNPSAVDPAMHPPPMAEMHNGATLDIDPLNSILYPTNFNYEFDEFSEDDEDAFWGPADLDQVDVDQNSFTPSLYDFLWNWIQESRLSAFSKKKIPGPNIGSLQRQKKTKPKHVYRCELQGDHYDIQGINWSDMEVTRQEAKQARKKSYRNYESIPPHHVPYSTRLKKDEASLPNVENYLRFRRMDLQRKPHLGHFQLRNLIACTSQNNVFFAGKFKVHHANPLMGTSSTIMDLADSDLYGDIKVSTIAAKDDILLAGGLNGEYGMINLRSSKDSGYVGGLITEALNPITNHISLSLSRSSGLPQAAFASNDNVIRILDCTTNKVVAAHTYFFPVNCTAISPDSRLRVIVGDTTSAYICDTETGTPIEELKGHSDFGFACAWADNGWHVATGNQDMTVKVWDARMWKDRHGNANPLTTMHSELAGVRSLQFSPLGSGKRILLACEAADVLDVIDAESFKSKQVLDFFGEIGGACFTPDGQDIFVANCDNFRGGLLELERAGEGARMGYRMSRVDVDEINRDISRSETLAWLNGKRDSDGNLNHKSKSGTAQKARVHNQEDINHACADEPFTQLNRVFSSEQQQQILPPCQETMDWNATDEDILDSENNGYTSIAEKMRQQVRGYDWRPTDAQVIADSKSNGRTMTWHRRKHLFADGGTGPLMGGGESAIDIGL